MRSIARTYLRTDERDLRLGGLRVVPLFTYDMKEGMQLTVINLTGYELKKYRTSLHDGRGPLDCGRLCDHVEPNLTDVA